MLEGHETDPLGSVPALRFMAAAHRLVLRGEAPALARHYPSAGGEPDAGDPWPDFRAVIADHAGKLRELIELPVQTNEVGRSAALLGGFLHVARVTGLPLATLEIGCSAGLNLRWNRWLYDAGPAGTWGDPDSPRAPRRPLRPGASARRGRRRRGAPRLRRPAPRSRLRRSAGDAARLHVARPGGPLHAARRRPAGRRRGSGGDRPGAGGRVAGDRLDEPRPGVATVVFQSIVLQYLDDDQRAGVRAAIEAAGAGASADAPLAWLSMEPGGDLADVRLRVWPDGEDSLIARAGYHGRPVRWLGA